MVCANAVLVLSATHSVPCKMATAAAPVCWQYLGLRPVITFENNNIASRRGSAELFRFSVFRPPIAGERSFVIRELDDHVPRSIFALDILRPATAGEIARAELLENRLDRGCV